MSHRTFIIGIVETSNSISDIVGKCKTKSLIEPQITVSGSLSDFVGKKCKALIMDKIPGSTELKMLNSAEFADADLIICSDEISEIEVPDEIIARAYDFFPFSLPEKILFSRFNHFLDYLVQKSQRWLCENYLDSVINLLPDLIWFKDINGAHVKVNDAFCKACGKEKSDVQGKGHAYIWDVDEEEFERGQYVCKETDMKAITTKQIVDNEELVQCDKGLRQFHTRKAPLISSSGEVFGTVGIASDITDIKNMDSELKVILGNLPFATLVTDIDGHIVSINKKFCDFFATDAANMNGKLYDLWENYHLPDLAPFAHMKSYDRTVPYREGKRTLQVTKEPILNMFDMISGCIYIFHDVTLERNYQQRILKMANTDYLTELYNRRYLYEFLSVNRSANDIVFFYIDIDNFKNINDTFGHKVGDDVLCILAHILKETFPDGVCFRLGGDEFVAVMLNVTSIAKAEEYAAKVLEGINNRFGSIAHIPDITGSIGVVFNPPASLGIDDLIRRGDQALYNAKNTGKNKYCIWSPELE
ncbi:MAG: diguanylate cyclase [Clostridia bacterium]|nr:diguanylate cyclase [Clostridia bacterium]